MNETGTRPLSVIVKIIVPHTITYSIMGLLAPAILDYECFFQESWSSRPDQR